MRNILARGGIEFIAVLLGLSGSLWMDNTIKEDENKVQNRKILSRLYNNLLSDDEGKYWEKNVAPYVKSASGMQTWELLSWASVGEDGPPPKFMERSLWVSKPGQDDNVRRTIS